jgi:hypothetical protein
MHHRSILAVVGICVLPALTSLPAQAAYPGKNGKLVLLSCDLYTINPDGSDLQQITFGHPCPQTGPGISEPTWSPDGRRIAYTDAGDVHVINADGSGDVNLTENHSEAARSPSWSPDGTRIAYGGVGPTGPPIHVWSMNADGTDVHRVDDTCAGSDPHWHPAGERIEFRGFSDPPGCVQDTGYWLIRPDGTDRVPFAPDDIDDWSPDGGQVVFDKGCVGGNCCCIYTQPADGSAPPTSITTGTGFFPHWSPDGTRIAFRGRQPGDNMDFVYTMNTDGSDWERVSSRFVTGLSWQPIPVNSYPRPKFATPLDLSLVPAYEPCTTPNYTHGPPLAFGSCGPPVRSSAPLTLGTPDANGKPIAGWGRVRYDTLGGDVRMAVQLRDVYDEPTMNDYTGEVRLRSPLRITDKRNTPHPGGPGAGTVSDTTLGATLLCAATADNTVGASCSLNTTANALAPATVTSGARTVWELGQVQVDDSGADGDADTVADNTVFMRQGIFVP